jgi:L-lactate dehydrogenase
LANVPGVSEVVLLGWTKPARSEAADIAHAAAFNAALVCAGDYADLGGAQVVVMTAGTGLKLGETRLDLLAPDVDAVSSVLERRPAARAAA